MAVTVVGGTGLLGLIIGIAFHDITENFADLNLEKCRRTRENLFMAREEGHRRCVRQYNFPPDQLSYIIIITFLDHTPLVGASGGIAIVGTIMSSLSTACSAAACAGVLPISRLHLRNDRD